jgi:hemerythrin-like domain-containing protein
VCEYCGCRGVPPIAELMEEHDVILVDAHEVRTALRTGDRAEVVERLRRLASHLDPHVRREEQGIFTALRDQGDWADEVAQLEGEHRGLDSAIADLDVLAPDFDRDVLALLLELERHVERENLGIFPVSVVTLGAAGWELVERARDEIPTFLPDVPRSALPGR